MTKSILQKHFPPDPHKKPISGQVSLLPHQKFLLDAMAECYDVPLRTFIGALLEYHLNGAFATEHPDKVDRVTEQYHDLKNRRRLRNAR